MITIQEFLNSLAPAQRELLQEQRKHHFTVLDFDRHVSFDPETSCNLFDEIQKKERFIIDRNAAWQPMVANPKNAGKAFILGKTMFDESENLEVLLFGSKTNNENGNLFTLGIQEHDGKYAIHLHRIDKHYRLTLEEHSLSEFSNSKNARIGRLEYDKKRMEDSEFEKRQVLVLLGVKSIQELPEPKQCAEKIEWLLGKIEPFLGHCSRDWIMSAVVSRLSIALLLVEKLKVRTDFAKSEKVNFFGDTMILHNALFLDAKIITEDRMLRRMARLLEVECVKDV